MRLEKGWASAPELEAEADAQLGSKRDADGGAGAKEITESAREKAELIEAGDGLSLRAGSVEAEGGGIGEIVDGYGKRGKVGDVIRAGIAAIEQVEDLDEGIDCPAILKFDWPADAEIDLEVGSAAEFVEGGFNTVDDGARADWGCDGEGPRAFHLSERGQLESAGSIVSSGEDGAMTDILTRRAVVARGKRVKGITNTVHIIKQLAQYTSPSVGAGECVVQNEVETVGDVALETQQQGVVAGAIVGAKYGKVGDVGVTGNGIYVVLVVAEGMYAFLMDDTCA